MSNYERIYMNGMIKTIYFNEPLSEELDLVKRLGNWDCVVHE
jgi:hypothetical protein